jgi:vacuolar-type H+-ATPase subunit E/Vma4
MSDIDAKLKRFTEAITSDAEADSKAILEDVRRQRESSLQSAEDEALGDAYRYIKTEIGRLRVENGRTLSRKMMDNKRTLYARRAALSESALRDVMARLAAYVGTPAYVSRLRDMAREAADAFGGGQTVIALRREDMALVPELRQAVSGRPVTFVEGAFHLGGLTAECPEKQQQLNQTFDASLAEWKTRFFAELVIEDPERSD